MRNYVPVRALAPAVLLTLAAAGILLLGAGVLLLGDDAEATAAASVLAVDEHGDPVPGAVAVWGGDGTGEEAGRDRAEGRATADEQGRLEVEVATPMLVSVTADGHLPRVVAVAPAEVSHAVLSEEAGKTLSLRVGGDVMFGRRFYDADGDGSPGDGLLGRAAGAREHADLLEQVAPLLADADLTVVNLETPLLDEPLIGTLAPRTQQWNPTKDLVFASAPAAVDALVGAGVDAVSLGNNHVFDALDSGLEQTIAELDRAGLAHFGAGATVDDAWRPAFLERRGQRVAMIGCTTVTGNGQTVENVAGADQGGAARCTRERLVAEVGAARRQADVVLLMIHGGEEYRSDQSDVVLDLSRAAREAGAALVVNGHPHVVGGVEVDADGALLARSTGNLLFDQDVWPTFLSYLLRADVRDGRVVSAITDPILLEDYVPRPVTGDAADASARRAAGLASAGSASLLPPGARAPATPQSSLASLASRSLPLQAGVPRRLPNGWWLDDDFPADVRRGEDLLWTGSFEDEDTDPGSAAGASWTFAEPAGRLSAAAACSGRTGVELRRGPLSAEDAVLTPDHRQLTSAGTQLTLLVDVRAARGDGVVELRVYPDTKGQSSQVVSARVPGRSGDGCRTIRLDMTVPAGGVAVQPFVRLVPPGGVQLSSRLSVDAVRLVAWSADDGAGGPRWGYLEARETDEVDLVAVRGTPWP